MFNRVIFIVAVAVFSSAAFAQTQIFTFHGSLKDGANPANGTYDLEFKLFDSLEGGTSFGTQTRSAVQVVNGIFSVSLSYGGVFFGPDRYLEIGVRPGGTTGAFQQLLPRQMVTSAPYAIRAGNAGNSEALAGVAASQYVQTTDVRLSDARPPTSGSANYIQNQNGGVQAGSNFNISGAGTVGGALTGNSVRSDTDFLIGNNSILRINLTGTNPFTNTFVGFEAGLNSAPITFSGFDNSFFGEKAGRGNTVGSNNSIFGAEAGSVNMTGSDNSFFGYGAARGSIASRNSIFGFQAGTLIKSDDNSMFGHDAGRNTSTGGYNSFFGRRAGYSNTTGIQNTAVGSSADFTSDGLSYATAIGAGSKASLSDSIYLGRPGGQDTVRIPGDLNTTGFVGIGTAAPHSRLDVRGDISIGVVDDPNGAGGNNLYVANDGGDANNVFRLDGSNNNFFMIARSGAGSASGAGLVFRTAAAGGGETTRMTINSTGTVEINTLGAAGSTHLCRNASLEIATCSPSLREVEDVRNDRIGDALINTVKEQQDQIDAQKRSIEKLTEQNTRQQLIIESLVRSICKQNSNDEVCKQEK